MIEGFFTKKDTESKTRPDGKFHSCHACGLYKDCRSPRMKPFGQFKKKILNIGEAPGEQEDRNGKPWQGKAGQLLQKTYKKLGIDLFEDCLNINAVSCRPIDEQSNNRAPSNFEVECCRRAVFQVIEQYNPKVIILLGNTALFSLIGHRWKKDLAGITKWRGWTIPDQDFKAWICPTFHPSYIERGLDEGASVEQVIWLRDLQAAFAMQDAPFYKYVEPEIEIIEDLSILKKITSQEIAFDYETTGIKPQAVGHRIICASVADSINHCYSFMMPPSRREKQPFLDLITNPKIGKIAQNMKYEDTWSEVRLKTSVYPWIWDTMQATHIFDNRPGVTGLKFQVYVRFGIVDYDSEVSPYLEATDSKNGNALNKIQVLIGKPGGKNKLLKYCAYDSVYELRLYHQQMSDTLPF